MADSGQVLRLGHPRYFLVHHVQDTLDFFHFDIVNIVQDLFEIISWHS